MRVGLLEFGVVGHNKVSAQGAPDARVRVRVRTRFSGSGRVLACGFPTASERAPVACRPAGRQARAASCLLALTGCPGLLEMFGTGGSWAGPRRGANGRWGRAERTCPAALPPVGGLSPPMAPRPTTGSLPQLLHALGHSGPPRHGAKLLLMRRHGSSKGDGDRDDAGGAPASTCGLGRLRSRTSSSTVGMLCCCGDAAHSNGTSAPLPIFRPSSRTQAGSGRPAPKAPNLPFARKHSRPPLPAPLPTTPPSPRPCPPLRAPPCSAASNTPFNPFEPGPASQQQRPPSGALTPSSSGSRSTSPRGGRPPEPPWGKPRRRANLLRSSGC